MTEYKSIREWIAEGVNPVGYVDAQGRVVSSVSFTSVTQTADLQEPDQKYVKVTTTVTLDHPVAAPKPKRLSDEELLRDLLNAARKVGMNEAGGIRISQDTDRQYTLRDAVLDRMKAKGPTRGEVEKRFSSVFWSYEGSRLFREHRAEFLSMFPEGEE